MSCFAHDKNSDYASTTEKRAKNDICYVLRSEDYIRMKSTNSCGTTNCPFYKESRKDIRHE